MSSALCPLKGWKPALCGDAGLHGEAWPERPREALRLRLLSRPCFLSPPPRLTRRRSRRPVGGGWLSSSPSSCRRVIWGKSWLGVRWEWRWVLHTENFVLSKCPINVAWGHIYWMWAATNSWNLAYISIQYFPHDLKTLCLPNLIDVELLNQVQIGALPPQVSLGHCLHALFLQTVHHIIEWILVRQRCKRLYKKERRQISHQGLKSFDLKHLGDIKVY